MLFTLLQKILRRVNSRISARGSLSVELAPSYPQLQTLAQRGEWLELEQACCDVLAEKPDTAEAVTLLAYSLLQQNRLAEAAEFATKAAMFCPSDWLSNFTSGVVFKGLGNTKEASEYLRRAVVISPNDAQTKRQWVEAVAASEDISTAALEYAAVCRQSGCAVDVISASVRPTADWAHLSGLSLSHVNGQKQSAENVAQASPAGQELPPDPLNTPYVADMTSIRIFSGSNLLLTSDGIAISDTDVHPRNGSFVIAQEPEMLLLDIGKFDYREIDVGVLMCGESSSIYDDWQLAFLPKLQFLQQYNGFADLPIIVDAYMPQIHFEQLKRLVSNPLILLKANESLLCRRLLVASPPPFLQVLEELGQVRLLAEQRDWIELEERCRKMLIANCELAEPMVLLAYSLQQQGQPEEAAEFATQAAARLPNSWLPNFIAGTSLLGLDKLQEASEFLKRANILAPEDKQTIRQLIGAITASEGIEAAATEYAALSQQISREAHTVIAPVRTVPDWAALTGLAMLDAGEVEEIPFKNPHIWGSPANPQTKIALSNKPYVADITNARIFSNSSLILTADGTALSDTGGHPKFGHYVSFAYESAVLAQQAGKVLLNLSEFKTREIEGGIFLSGLASSAFGHWLPEFLPKLEFLQHHPDFADLPIIVDAQMPPSHFDHLQRLTSNPLILLQANESLICQRLLVAPSPAFLPVELFPNDIPLHELPGLSLRAMRFLQGHQPLGNTPVREKRLFLARKNMKWRRLLNEPEIADDLATLGFETVFMEELTVREQIELFGQAQWIVAPNGSALLNIVFADPTVKLLVLTQPNLHNWGTFQGPIDALGYQSICVPGNYATAEGNKHSDYQIPIEHIRQALFDWGMYEALDRAIIPN